MDIRKRDRKTRSVLLDLGFGGVLLVACISARRIVAYCRDMWVLRQSRKIVLINMDSSMKTPDCYSLSVFVNVVNLARVRAFNAMRAFKPQPSNPLCPNSSLCKPHPVICASISRNLCPVYRRLDPLLDKPRHDIGTQYILPKAFLLQQLQILQRGPRIRQVL